MNITIDNNGPIESFDQPVSATVISYPRALHTQNHHTFMAMWVRLCDDPTGPDLLVYGTIPEDELPYPSRERLVKAVHWTTIPDILYVDDLVEALLAANYRGLLLPARLWKEPNA